MFLWKESTRNNLHFLFKLKLAIYFMLCSTPLCFLVIKSAVVCDFFFLVLQMTYKNFY